MTDSDLIIIAKKEAERTMKEGKGGPFGAIVVDMEGKIYTSSNTVISSSDPTAHAEVNAIRKACKEKGTYDLSGCILYATSYPCPMCLSAAIWANIKTLYYEAESEEASKIGFRDDYIYDYIKGGNKDEDVLKIIKVEKANDSLNLFKEYKELNKVIY